MSDNIVRTTVEENDANIIKSQVMNVLDDNLIRHQVRGLDQPAPEPPVLETLNVTENGTYIPEEGVDGFDEVNVDVELHGDSAYDLKDAPAGSISTFTDGIDLPLNKLVVGIDSQSGVSECNLVVNGINMWDEEWELGGYREINGTKDSAIDTIRSKNYISVLPNTNYFCTYGEANKIYEVFYYDINKNYINFQLNNGIVTTPSNCRYMTFRSRAAYGTIYNNDISINYPSTDTSYHAYNGHNYQINFPSGVTISNGSIDILNGVLTDDDLSETYNINPIAIRSLEGVNNVFADTGDIEELEYFYDVTTEIKDEVIAFLDFNENYTESHDVFYDKINGTPSVQSHRSITYDADGNMIFDNTNGYLWIAQYLGFNKAYKIEIDIVGKTSYVADDGTNIFKFNIGNNHVICSWDADNSSWKMQDWTGHDTRLNEDFDFFNGKKLDIFFNASYVDGVLTKNSNNTLTMYVGTTLVYAWEQSASLTGDDNIACIGLGHNTACKNFAFKSVKITKLNNVSEV